MDSVRQGDIGVTTAMLHYQLKGYTVLLPATDRCRYDLAYDDGISIKRVQVKTSTYVQNSSHVVQLRTTATNNKGVSNIKQISEEETDKVFVLTSNGKAFEFDSSEVAGMNSISPEKKYRDKLVGIYAPLV